MNAKQKLKHFKLQNKNVTKTNLNENPPILFPWMKFFSYIECALPNDSLFLFYNLELKKTRLPAWIGFVNSTCLLTQNFCNRPTIVSLNIGSRF